MHYSQHDIPVDGGTLRVGVWGESGPVVLCSHGLSANHLSYQWLARELGDDYRIVAPDHRGRGFSDTIIGPWGMSAHADDVARCLDYFELPTVPIMVGHSMGAFISAVTHHRHPSRIEQLLFIDGGLPLADELPSGISPEALITAIVGPAMERLDKEFASEEAFLDFWRAHPALANDWCPELENYLRYELRGQAPAIRSCVRKEAILGDTESQLMTDDIPNAIRDLRIPLEFLYAPKGLLNQEPLYSRERMAEMQTRLTQMDIVDVEGVNHYTILLSARGAKAIAERVRQLLD